MLANVLSSTTNFSEIFVNFTASDFLDVIIMSMVFYFIFLFIKQTHSYIIINATIFLFAVYYLSTILDLALVRQFFQPLLTFIVIILVIVFQGELRQFVRWVSAPTKFHFKKNFSVSNESIQSICTAVSLMAEKKIGALIVFQGEQAIEDLLDGGHNPDARISTNLLLSIFDPHTPGHDGAVVIAENRIRKFSTHLPLAEHFNDFRKVGLRHRAAVGLTEQSDSLVVVVSEERGTISVAENGHLKKLSKETDLKDVLLNFYKQNEIELLSWKSFANYLFIKNFWTKFISIFLALTLWFFLVFQSGIVTKEISLPVEVKFLPKEYQVKEIDFKSIKVIVGGKQKDIENLDLTKGFPVTVDAKAFQEGQNKVEINTTMFNLPSYLTIKNFSPNLINVDIIKANTVIVPIGESATTTLENKEI